MNRSSWIVGLVGVAAVSLGAWFLVAGSQSEEPTSNPAPTPAPSEAKAELSPVRAKPLVGDRMARAEPITRPELSTDVLAARNQALRLARERTRSTGPFQASEPGLQAAVAARQSDIDSCFKTARYHEPELPGNASLSLTLEPDGDDIVVASAATTFEGDADGTILNGCLTTVFEELDFEGSAGTLSCAVALSAE